jgi:hypothetical protein
MMDMGKPRNSLFMAAGDGPFGSIFMGGMFTVLKIRKGLKSYEEDPGWYDHPAGTVASPVGEKAAAGPSHPHAHGPSVLAQLASSGVSFDAVKAGSCASLASPRRIR